MGCKGGAEIAVEIQAERNSPRVGPGTNCRGSVGNKGGFPKHLARCCTDLSRFVPPVSDPSALNFSQFVGYDQIPEFPGMDLKRESCRNVRIWRKSTAVQRKEPLFSERAMGISKLERVLGWTQSSQQILVICYEVIKVTSIKTKVCRIAELLQMLGLVFLKLFVLSTLLIFSRFLPAPGFYEGRRLSLPNGFLCICIPAVVTRLSTTHWRPFSLIHFSSLMSVMTCWAIGRMIASSFDWMRGICLGSIFFALIAPARPPGSHAQWSWYLNSYSLIVHDISAWSFAHAPTQCTVCFSASISAVLTSEKFLVMTWSNAALLTSWSDVPPIKSFCACASDWISDPPVLWINFWNLLSNFSKWDFVEMEYPVRNVSTFRSPTMILRRPSDLFISVWIWVFMRLWRSGRVAAAWSMLIMLIRSPSCVIASRHKTSPWAMCYSAFFLVDLARTGASSNC